MVKRRCRTRLAGGWLAVFLALSVLIVPSTRVAGAADIVASLERNPIRADETVRLVLEMDQSTVTVGPDLSPLQQNFEVLGTSTSTQIQFVNGQQSASTRWIVEIAPRRAGRLTIPRLDVGPHQTPPLELEVLPAPAGASGNADGDIFIEAEISTHNPYVQAQVRYSVRLFRAVEILDGTLQEPHAGDALVHRLGRDLGYSQKRNGRTFRVIERRYAIFPQSSGQLEIPGVRFDGEVADSSAGSSAFNRLFTQGRRVRLITEPFVLEVRPRPPEFQGTTWLPARGLNLIEQWSEDPPTPQVGEPLTRTLILKATGLRAEQLPEITFASSEALKIYPDQPTAKTSSDAESMYALRELRFAVVPTRPGEVDLSAITVRWWDTESDQAREAVIAARTLTIAAAPAEATGVLPALGPLDSLADATSANADRTETTRRWQWVSALLAILWLATGVAWWRAAGRRAARAGKEDRAPHLDRARRALRSACARNDALAAKQALVQWAAAAWPDERVTGLTTLANRLDANDLGRELRSLDRRLYGRLSEWRGDALWRQARRALVTQPARKTQAPALPELYPSRQGV